MTTTETPSVDEARRAVLQARAEGRFIDQQDGPLDRYAAAVRAEAIRERDEALGLLREAERDFSYLVQMVVANDPKHIDNGTKHRQNGIIAEAVAVGAQGVAKLRAFLARFPEATEGGEG